LERAETDFARQAGMLADPDGFDNPLLIGLRESSDSALENSPTLPDGEAGWPVSREADTA